MRCGPSQELDQHDTSLFIVASICPFACHNESDIASRILKERDNLVAFHSTEPIFFHISCCKTVASPHGTGLARLLNVALKHRSGSLDVQVDRRGLCIVHDCQVSSRPQEHQQEGKNSTRTDILVRHDHHDVRVGREEVDEGREVRVAHFHALELGLGLAAA